MDIHKTIEQRIIELEDRVIKLEELSLHQKAFNAGENKIKKMSAKEFLITKKLKTETQKTVAIGYYLEYMEAMESFNIDDLIGAFQFAKEKRPQNLNDIVNKNIARGLIMEAKQKKNGKKAWVLTVSGENFVKDKLKK